MILEMLKLSIILVVSLIGMYFVFGFIYQIIEAKSNYYIIKTFGLNGLLITGIGTVIHEFSHYLMCKIFGHDVTEVKLFRPFKFKDDGILGYVKHSYDRNSLLQRIGNFFIGIAPMIIGTLVMLLILIILFPKLYTSFNYSIKISEPIDIFKVFTENIEMFYESIFNVNNIVDIKFWIFIYLMLSITLHMSLSKPDLENAKEGLLYIFILSIFIAFIFHIFNLDILKMFSYILIYNSFLFALLSLGLIFSIIGLFITYVMYKVKQFIIR